MVNFNNIKNNKNIYLYAGDIDSRVNRRQHIPFIGLSLTRDNENHY